MICEVTELRPVVLDTSVLAEVVMHTVTGALCLQELNRIPSTTHIPAQAITETLAVLKNHERGRLINSQQAAKAVQGLIAFPATRWEPDPFINRIWELRHNFSIYDAGFVALAEHLNAWVFTKDGRKADAIRAHTTCKLLQF